MQEYYNEQLADDGGRTVGTIETVKIWKNWAQNITTNAPRPPGSGAKLYSFEEDKFGIQYDDVCHRSVVCIQSHMNGSDPIKS